jgi:hypothetical protein
MQWYKVDQLNKCIAYKGEDNCYIMFGPDLSKFIKFTALEDLLSHCEQHGLMVTFK